MTVRLTLYTKEGCHLCEDLAAVVARVRKDAKDVELEVVDIARDPALTAKYGAEIPVLLIDGRRAFKYRATEAELRRKIARARAGKRRGGAGAPSPRGVETAEPVPELDPELDPEPRVPPRPLAALLIAATLGAAGWFIATGAAQASRGTERLTAKLLRADPRDKTPVPFTLDALDGGKVSLSDYDGKVVFLNFWATWCPPCVEEMPSMLRLHDALKDRHDFVMLAAAADDTAEPVQRFFGGQVPGMKVLLDAGGKVAASYGTTMFPETYVIVDGRIRAFIEGPRDWDAWFAKGYLDTILAKR